MASCANDFTKSFPGPFIDGCDLLTVGAARASAAPATETPLENEPAFASKVIRVSATGNSRINGASWGSATTLEHALEIADEDTELWLKAGTYRGSVVSSTQLASFVVDKGLRIFGGFAGTEKTRNQKDPVTNVTILSGKLNARIANNIMKFTGDGIANVFVSGLTLQDGGIYDEAEPNTGDFATTKAGGAALIQTSNTTVEFKDCIMQDNHARQRGGHIYVAKDEISTGVTNLRLILRDCILQRGTTNKGHGDGGAIMALISGGGGITCINTQFINQIAWDDGVAIRMNACPELVLTNCVFVGNRLFDSILNGGTFLIQTFDGTTVFKVTNCTFEGNSYNGGTLMAGGANGSYAYNCIDRNNSGVFTSGSTWSVINCNIEGGVASVSGTNYNNIIDADPQFVQNWDSEALTFDLHLKNSSPSLNRGANNLVSADSSTDIEGNARVQNGTVDQGAYESSDLLVAQEIITATGSGDDVNPSPAVNTTLVNTLNDGVAYANTATGTLQNGVDDGQIRYIKANVLDFDGVATRTPYTLDCTASNVVDSMAAVVTDIVFDANNELAALQWNATTGQWTVLAPTTTATVNLAP